MANSICFQRVKVSSWHLLIPLSMGIKVSCIKVTRWQRVHLGAVKSLSQTLNFSHFQRSSSNGGNVFLTFVVFSFCPGCFLPWHQCQWYCWGPLPWISFLFLLFSSIFFLYFPLPSIPNDVRFNFCLFTGANDINSVTFCDWSGCSVSMLFLSSLTQRLSLSIWRVSCWDWRLSRLVWRLSVWIRGCLVQIGRCLAWIGGFPSQLGDSQSGDSVSQPEDL